ncbi:hypothetical protein [Leucobacter soli]|uniref:hypothetical protein n=1 Tax=Leucobacter soli TaxID=2812850 RepID=UPI00360B23A3
MLGNAASSSRPETAAIGIAAPHGRRRTVAVARCSRAPRPSAVRGTSGSSRSASVSVVVTAASFLVLESRMWSWAAQLTPE